MDENMETEFLMDPGVRYKSIEQKSPQGKHRARAGILVLIRTCSKHKKNARADGPGIAGLIGFRKLCCSLVRGSGLGRGNGEVGFANFEASETADRDVLSKLRDLLCDQLTDGQ